MPMWRNADGLAIQLGVDEGIAGRAGEYEFDGPNRFIEMIIDASATTNTDTVVDWNVVIPKGARIEKVEVQVQTAFTSAGAATLNVGGVRTDTFATDASGGFVNAAALATINADGRFQLLTVGSTGAGTYIGTTLARNVYLSSRWNTASYTAGRAYVRIFYNQSPPV